MTVPKLGGVPPGRSHSSEVLRVEIRSAGAGDSIRKSLRPWGKEYDGEHGTRVPR
jgi:hypothetical protein